MFNPDKTCRVSSFEDAYTSGAPTLTYIDLTYGEGSSLALLVPYISCAYGACGFMDKSKVTNFMMTALAQGIKNNYYYLNMMEIALFFNLFVMGKYETFYGNPNPQVISKSMVSFVKDRAYHVGIVEENRQKAKILAQSSKDAMTYEEYLVIKQIEDEYMMFTKEQESRIDHNVRSVPKKNNFSETFFKQFKR